ncbi:sulfate ABC transporter permease subunit CysT [Helicobacter sp. MIT 14-3879]|uniref:sulfate ABC transporter permease subunit CysT n=1 Tax=Helicobacter sp. MIT 14-3879 TaxID=2040649 RepID=UPI000E1F4C5D|nr:sulfate ABC transporter permease subunit CysT [Helicobacter sp. MIT 14-3879]RDU65497.1 sulfate ABC transporter permease subunit CysT [Helicobacter sp. MIT 14-3879]
MINKKPFVKPSVLPGFKLSFGLGILYMSLLVFIPIIVLVLYSIQIGAKEFYNTIADRQVLNALYFSLSVSFCAAFINLIFGFIIAWTLVNYDFFGKKLIDAMIDLPFALPTAVAGISLAYLISNQGIIGKFLGIFGFDSTNASFFGVTIAIIFIGLPFVVRTLEPLLKDLDIQSIEAASSLGANFIQTFIYIILPSLLPACLTGFALAFARGLGEYGSVIFISNNIPFESQILPVVIVGKIESHNYIGASVIGVFMIVISFILLFLINILQNWNRK